VRIWKSKREKRQERYASGLLPGTVRFSEHPEVLEALLKAEDRLDDHFGSVKSAYAMASTAISVSHFVPKVKDQAIEALERLGTGQEKPYRLYVPNPEGEDVVLCSRCERLSEGSYYASRPSKYLYISQASVNKQGLQSSKQPAFVFWWVVNRHGHGDVGSYQSGWCTGESLLLSGRFSGQFGVSYRHLRESGKGSLHWSMELGKVQLRGGSEK